MVSVKTRPGDLVMPDQLGLLFSQNLDYFRPYKNQVEPGYEGHPNEFTIIFLDHFGLFGTIEDHLGPYWKFWDHFFFYLKNHFEHSACQSPAVAAQTVLWGFFYKKCISWLNNYCLFWSSWVVTFTDGSPCQSVTLVSQLQTGQTGVRANIPGSASLHTI